MIIEPVSDLVRIEAFFPNPWYQERIVPLLAIRLERTPRTSVFILDGDTSGCTVTVFDGMGTLAHLWTQPAFRNKGYAQRLVLEVADWWLHVGPNGKQHIPILARYRKDEYNVHKLFTKMGYEIVHEGRDDFMIVMARTLRGSLNT